MSTHTSLFAALEAQIARMPESFALSEGKETFTYQQLGSCIHLLQNFLRQFGCAPLEKIAWAELRGKTFISLSYAITDLGAIAVPLNPHASVEEWNACCHQCDVTVLLVAPALVAKATALFELNQHLRYVGIVDWQGQQPVLRSLQQRAKLPITGASQPGDAFILCTSGTTGRPKGVVLTHVNLLVNQEAVAQCQSLSHADVMLVLKPYFHSSTIMEMLLLLQAGGHVIVGRRFLPRAVPAWIEETATTLLCLVPTMVYDLLAELERQKRVIRGKCIISIAAGAIEVDQVEALRQFLPEAEIFYGYGLTEASPRVSTLLPSEWSSHARSSGRAIPGMRIAIWDAAGREIAPGTIGEVVVTGPSVMRCYYNDPALTQQRLQHGWLRTHDLGWLDEAGYLYIYGREDEMINCGGQKVAPQEIEQVLSLHPAVQETAVCAYPDQRLGQIPVAFLIKKENLASEKPSADEIIQFCRRYLSPFKVPRHIHWLQNLPRTASGKVRRRALVELYGEEMSYETR
ncbi:MAG TPA: class I adenylate-forming enzyme family protein [Ktedonosporobacter sp.]|jgi:acyl-CoA synthetase (AMP-forming)/AMP-acid ligase II|nr:class I adenylate-forming enzyme family protein [Ktedonosporobacter sp.]